MTKTFSAKPADVVHEWFVIDATDKVLGRVASEVALRLRGKHKAIYTPHVDTGDFIVIVNAAQLRVTGAKPLDKIYYSHSGYPGGISSINFRDMQAKFPGRALEKAVKGMLPKGPLGYAMIKKLKVYAGAEHPHTAQQPKVLEIAGISAINFRDMQSKFPGRALEKAVKGMLPKGPLGYAMIKKLKVYAGAEHPHTAQQPKVLEIAALNKGAAK